MKSIQVLKEFCKAVNETCEQLMDDIERERFVCSTVNDVELFIVVEDDEQLCVKSVIGRVDLRQPNITEVYAVLLEANFEFSGTRGATIGVNSNTGEVVLFYQCLCHEIGQEAFQQMLYEFAEVCKVWSSVLQSSGQGAG